MLLGKLYVQLYHWHFKYPCINIKFPH